MRLVATMQPEQVEVDRAEHEVEDLAGARASGSAAAARPRGRVVAGERDRACATSPERLTLPPLSLPLQRADGVDLAAALREAARSCRCP